MHLCVHAGCTLQAELEQVCTHRRRMGDSTAMNREHEHYCIAVCFLGRAIFSKDAQLATALFVHCFDYAQILTLIRAATLTISSVLPAWLSWRIILTYHQPQRRVMVMETEGMK